MRGRINPTSAHIAFLVIGCRGRCLFRPWRRKRVLSNSRWMLRRGVSRALPVADKARRTSGSGQNFGGSNAAAKFWASQQDIAAETGTKRWCGANQDGCYSGIAAEIDTKNMPLAYFLNVSTPACFLNAPTPLPLILIANNKHSSTVAIISGSGAKRKSIRHTRR